MIQQYIDSAIGLIGQHTLAAYILVVVISFTESFAFLGLIVPGSTLVVIAGFLASRDLLDLPMVLACASLGAYLADISSYHLARRYGDQISNRKFYQKNLVYVDKGIRFFENHGGKSLIFGRFIGWFRPVLPFLAGLLRMNLLRFYIADIFGAALWAIGYIGFGYLFGASWKMLEAWTGRISLFLLILVGVIFAGKWVLRVTVGKAAHFANLTIRKFNETMDGASDHPRIKAWTGKHPKLAGFIHRRFDRNHAAGPALTMGLAITAVFTLLLAAVAENVTFHEALVGLDEILFFILKDVHAPVAADFFAFITLLGAMWPLTVFLAMVVAALLLQSRRIEAAFYTVGVIGGEIFLFALKYLIHRPGPAALFQTFTKAAPSFPSGHTFMSTAAWGLAVYFLLKLGHNKSIKKLVVPTYLILVILLGVGRVYMGFHWFSDVLGAWFAGFVWIAVVATAYEYASRRFTLPTGAAAPRRLRRIATLLIVLCLAFNVGFALNKVGEVKISAKIQMPPARELRGSPAKIIKDDLPLFTTSMLGRPAGPIQAFYVGHRLKLLDRLEIAGFVQLPKIRLLDLPRILSAASHHANDMVLPAVPYYYESRMYDLSYGLEEGRPFPRIVVRLWKTNIKIGGRDVIAMTVDRETGLYSLFSRYMTPLPFCDAALNQARKKFANMLHSKSVIVQTISMEAPGSGKNILNQPYIWDGSVLLITEKPGP